MKRLFKILCVAYVALWVNSFELSAQMSQTELRERLTKKLYLHQDTNNCPYCRAALKYADGSEVQSLVMADPNIFDLEATHVDKKRAIIDELIAFARTYIGTRYRTRDKATGITLDCSGYCMMLFGHFGYEIPRTATSQYAAAPHVKRDEVRVGDIVLFRNRGNSRIGHVGIVTEVDASKNNFRFIHSSTSRGVISEWFVGNTYYTRRFVGFARII